MKFKFPSRHAIGTSLFHEEVVSAPIAERFLRAFGHNTEKGGTKTTINPFYLVSLASPGILKLLTKPVIEANFFRMVHAEQYLAFYSSISDGMKLNFHHCIADIVSTVAGDLLTVESFCKDTSSNTLICLSKSSFLFKGPNTKKRPKNAHVVSISDQIQHIRLTIGKNDAKKYARASGDNNPLHTNYIIARLAGLKKPILQGMYLLGLIYTKLMSTQNMELQTKPHAISCRFSGISYPEDNLDLEFIVQTTPEFKLDFCVINSLGKEILKKGQLEDLSPL